MANPQHVEILRRGVEVWNAWRQENGDVLIDLAGLNLTGLNLTDADLTDARLKAAHLTCADLTGAHLNGADLSGADLSFAHLNGTHISHAILRDALLRDADLRDAILRDADLRDADLRAANLSGASLRGTNLSGAYLNEVYLTSADLSHTHLNGAKLRSTSLSGTDLNLADLTDADLSYADLRNAHLNYANLERTDLSNALLNGAELRQANLEYALLNSVDLRDANLSGAHLSNASLSRSIVSGADFTASRMGDTMLTDIDLSEAKGLETVSHYFRSTLGIDTIYISRGKIHEKFLRGCGLPESFIVQIPSLITAIESIQFYSCFISYSSKDHPFAERLYADLQNKGVRCWFAPEDMKIGDKIRDRIDESIRLHDKLLLILAEHSVSSQWVGNEVEAAFERERRENRTVLFPIRIDDAVSESKTGWAAAIRRTRHIGDFTCWKRHDSYQKAFDRLLRDLKAEDNQTIKG